MCCSDFLFQNLLIQSLVRLSSNPPSPLHSPTVGLAVIPLFMVAILSHVTICTSQYSSKILCGTSSVSLLVQTVTLVTLVFSCVLLGKLIPSAVKNVFRVSSFCFSGFTIKWSCSRVLLMQNFWQHQLGNFELHFLFFFLLNFKHSLWTLSSSQYFLKLKHSSMV